MFATRRGRLNLRAASRVSEEIKLDAWRLAMRIGVLSAAMMLNACAFRSNAPPADAPQVEGLPELMHQAETAAAVGDKDKARDAYRAAARAEPTNKAPWLKLAESY